MAVKRPSVGDLVSAATGLVARALALILPLALAGCQEQARQSVSRSSPELSGIHESASSLPPEKQESCTGIVHITEDPDLFWIETSEETLLFSAAGIAQESIHEGATVEAIYFFTEEGPLKAVSLTEVQPAPLWAEYISGAQKLLDEMTLEQKVGQLFFIRCPENSEAAIADIMAYQPGGLLLFGRDFAGKDARQVQDVIASYQQASPLPLLVGADEEGGTVVRVSSNPLLREERFCAPGFLYQKGGMEAVTADAREKSRLLLSLGVNVNLAPVCDVAESSADYIYPRTLGQDAQTTARYIEAVVEVMNQEKIGCVLKHFPGYGNNRDTHAGIAFDARPYEQFVQSDFLPFQAGIDGQAGCVLVSHNIVEAMDSQWPASLSPRVHQILREELGFEGVILTDDLVMDAIRSYTDGASAAIQAVLAGNDMLIVTDYQQQFPAVLEAVRAGTLEETLIDAAARRVLCWKLALGILE